MSANITVTIAPPGQARIVSDRPNLLNVDMAQQGPPGPKGSSVVVTYTFTQASPSAAWVIVHNLGSYPSVTIADSTGREVVGDVTYIDGNQLTVVFSAPFSGVAYLN